MTLRLRHIRDLAAACFALTATAIAEEIRTPRIDVASIAWDEVAESLVGSGAAKAEGGDALTLVDRATGASASFAPWVRASAVPVLLPVNIGRLLRDDASKSVAAKPDPYLAADVTAFDVIDVGDAGFEAWIRVTSNGRGRSVILAGLALVYVADGLADKPAAVIDMAFPEGVSEARIYIIDGALRLSFERFGATYVLSANCAPAHSTRLGCDEARELLTGLARKLVPVGGNASAPARTAVAPGPASRPEKESASIGFTYHPPGTLIRGTGTGRADYTAYASLRFPIKNGPAYANSQVFMDGGNCLNTSLNLSGDVAGQPLVPIGAGYDCGGTGRRLTNDETSRRNYTFPWRDDFCEQRDWEIASCPSGRGHQGQDIRPSSCAPVPWQAGPAEPAVQKCKPFVDEVVAVADGTIVRSPGSEILMLYVNAATERYRVRYQHMSPKSLDADGMIDGRRVARGERIGLLGNYFERPFGTTNHLHFELMVPTRAGWLHVNPYASLIVSHERLIGERGRQVSDGD